MPSTPFHLSLQLELDPLGIALETPEISGPGPPIPRKSRKSEHFAEAVEEEEDDDDGYTQVTLEGGQVDIQGFTDGVERAALPLLSSSSARSSIIGGDSSGSSPMRNERRRSPPDVVPSGFSGSESPQSSKFRVTKGDISMPPEPTSPPPSPPAGGRVSAESKGSRQNPCSPPVPVSGSLSTAESAGTDGRRIPNLSTDIRRTAKITSQEAW